MYPVPNLHYHLIPPDKVNPRIRVCMPYFSLTNTFCLATCVVKRRGKPLEKLFLFNRPDFKNPRQFRFDLTFAESTSTKESKRSEINVDSLAISLCSFDWNQSNNSSKTLVFTLSKMRYFFSPHPERKNTTQFLPQNVVTVAYFLGKDPFFWVTRPASHNYFFSYLATPTRSLVWHPSPFFSFFWSKYQRMSMYPW